MALLLGTYTKTFKLPSGGSWLVFGSLLMEGLTFKLHGYSGGSTITVSNQTGAGDNQTNNASYICAIRYA